jgi:uncharacterized protein (DUF885 family)
VNPRFKAFLWHLAGTLLIATISALAAKMSTEARLRESYKDLLASEVSVAYDRGVAAGAEQVEPTAKACFNWWFGDNGKARLEQTRKYLCKSKVE